MEIVIMRKLRKTKHVLLITVCSFILASCLKNEPMKIPFQGYSPHNLGDGWEIATPADVSINEEALKEVYTYVHEDANLWQIRSVLVFRNNKLVAESYMKNKNDQTTPRAIWSCTKQVIGILTGIAVDKGLVSVGGKISDYLPQISQYPDKKDITIENLLMMKSGIQFDNKDDSEMLVSHSNSLNYIFNLKMHSTQGTQYKYNDGDPHVISAILQEKTGRATRDWAQEVLFSKIGITKIEWIKSKDDITMGGYGIKTTPRELGKIGQLILNDGMWGSERIVSSEWIEDMTSVNVPINETGNPDFAFGYQWWKDTKRNINFMWGRGGQLVFINKDKNLIVVITGEANTSGDFDLSAYALPVYDMVNSIAK